MIQGHVENGRIVTDDPLNLPDGTRVRIEPQDAHGADLPKGHPQRILATLERVGGLVGSDEEWDRLEQMVQDEREADLRRSIDRGDWGPSPR